MLSDEQISRLKWRSRRGMLENDLMLEKFYASRMPWLDNERLAGLDELLALDDNDLWDLLSGRKGADTRFSPMAATVLEAVRAA
jgi:antitoxin CptB